MSRELFAAAEALAGVPGRAALLSRLAQYRRVVLDGLSAMAPAEAPRTWSSLLLGLPLVPEAVAAVLSSPAADEALDDAALAGLVPQVRSAALDVLTSMEALEQPLRIAAHRRVVRSANAFIVGFSLAALTAAATTRAIEPQDLAKGKPWRASSKLFDCHPERLDCGGAATSIFFHTQLENEPWVEIDLGAPTQFRSLTVRNRSDGVRDRAVPLVLEVGDDRATWKQLATRAEEFSVWKPSFDAVTARYVRLRVARQSFLHLDSVKVHP